MKTRKKLLVSFISVLCLSFTAVGLTSCQKDTKGLEFTLTEDGTGYLVTGIGTATDTEIIIPSRYEGLPVTGIGDNAFAECSLLESITIPDGVTNIGLGAFGNC